MTENAVACYPSVLTLNRLKAKVNLGVGEQERKYTQEVTVDVRFYLPEPLSSSVKDDGEYICYHGLSEKIHALCERKEYRLIEYLTHEIYRLLRAEAPAEVKLWVKLHKLHILLDYVEGGSSYAFTDLPDKAWVAPE